MIMYEAHMSLLVVTYEHEATLLAHLPDLLLHLFELVRVRLFISNENNQDVRLFRVKMVHIEQASETAYEGNNPTER